jgi:hypothetical protein
LRSPKIASVLFALFVLRVPVAHAQRLDDIVLHVADAWSHRDARAVVALSARDGVSIETRDSRSGPLGTRQATAVLRKLFEERETVSIRPGMMQVVGGSPRRAFCEITWITRAPDTTELERVTIFVELMLADERWQITQIRLLP